MTVRIGVDTGGTFTDVVLYEEQSGEVFTTKTPSTPPNFDDGVLTGIEKILEKTETDPTRVSFLSHGTTVGTNAILEAEFPEIGLVTNEGLRDVLEIGDQTRPDLYDLYTDNPPILVPRRLRKEVPGRLDSDGNVVDPLDEAAVQSAVTELVDAGVDSIVVSMLFSFLNEGHEIRIKEIINDVDPEIDVALSSEVHPERREYDRTITTVLNEAIKVAIDDYLQSLEEGIDRIGIEAPLNIVHSGGGIFSAEQAAKRAIRTITSGPAAGAVAARKTAESEGYKNAIGMDMGGTSTDVSIIRNNEIVRSMEGEVNELPVKTPMIDINTVGAGGGSIAWIDDGGILRVGPKSAGADPGPICYDRGGENPTVTDANLLLGRLNPEIFLEGDMSITLEKTRERFTDAIADPLDQSVEEAAHSVLEIANARIARNVHNVTVERGDDPREFALIGFGGAGPLQTPAVARRLNISDIVIPHNPGVFSARGILVADVQIDESRAYQNHEVGTNGLRDQFEQLESRLTSGLRAQGFDEDEATYVRAIDIRYEGQSYELPVEMPAGEISHHLLESCIDKFHEKHERLYGHAMPEEPVEFVTLRLSGTISTATIRDDPSMADATVMKDEREVYFDETGFTPTTVYQRETLPAGMDIEGPAILEENGSTAIIPPETAGRVTERGNVHISI